VWRQRGLGGFSRWDKSWCLRRQRFLGGLGIGGKLGRIWRQRSLGAVDALVCRDESGCSWRELRRGCRVVEVVDESGTEIGKVDEIAMFITMTGSAAMSVVV
jgi:hypothetical protein